MHFYANNSCSKFKSAPSKVYSFFGAAFLAFGAFCDRKIALARRTAAYGKNNYDLINLSSLSGIR